MCEDVINKVKTFQMKKLKVNQIENYYVLYKNKN